MAMGNRLAQGGCLTVGGVILILLFAALQFPWERMRPIFESQLAMATGANVRLEALDLGISTRGPVADVMGLSMTWPGQPPFVLEMARVGPALSTSWFSGQPALAVDMAIAGGGVVGTIWPTGDLGFDGSFRDINPELLPLPQGSSPSPIDGVVSGTADVEQIAGQWAGDLRLNGQHGSVALPGLPLALPFDELAIDVTLGEDGSVEIRQASLDGPMASFDAQGAVGAAASMDLAPIDLQVDLRGVQQALHDPMRQQGIQLDGNGAGRVTVSGTASRPVLR